MSTNHYLIHTLLKPYLAGLSTEAEKKELERLLAEDPDLMAQIEEVEAGLEHYLQKNAVPPPPNLDSAIWQRINGTEIQKREPQQRTQAPPPPPEPAQSPYVDVEVSNTHIQVHKLWRTAFIAVFILSKVFLILGLYYYFKANSQEQEIERLKATVQQMAPAGRLP
ncbi:hypothetical protein [Spirosoma lacussanchae]|uniref:hypothetical protein n=1 Tax=Spirosoma lacussanchae TaxID=1884249 RepID=UPI001107EB73